MKITMNDSRITTIPQLRNFLKGNQGVDLSVREVNIDEKYQLINKTVKKFKYWKLSKRQKRPVLSYLKKLTGYRKPYLVFLIKQSLWGKLKRQQYHRVKW